MPYSRFKKKLPRDYHRIKPDFLGAAANQDLPLIFEHSYFVFFGSKSGGIIRILIHLLPNAKRQIFILGVIPGVFP